MTTSGAKNLDNQTRRKKNYFVAGSHKKMLKESKFEFLFDWNRK